MHLYSDRPFGDLPEFLLQTFLRCMHFVKTPSNYVKFWRENPFLRAFIRGREGWSGNRKFNKLNHFVRNLSCDESLFRSKMLTETRRCKDGLCLQGVSILSCDNLASLFKPSVQNFKRHIRAWFRRVVVVDAKTSRHQTIRNVVVAVFLVVWILVYGEAKYLASALWMKVTGVSTLQWRADRIVSIIILIQHFLVDPCGRWSGRCVSLLVLGGVNSLRRRMRLKKESNYFKIRRNNQIFQSSGV